MSWASATVSTPPDTRFSIRSSHAVSSSANTLTSDISNRTRKELVRV